MSKTSLILVDPQVGFCSAQGSLAKYYGYEELQEIRKTLLTLVESLSEVPRRHLVTSEYSEAQFTEGNTQHPLANLCVPEVNGDCKIAEELAGVQFHSHHIKHKPSALSSDALNCEIENELKQGVRAFVVAGFLFEHCVRSTAEELINKVSDFGASVYVCPDLSASRLEKYRNGEVQATIESLLRLGIGYVSWKSIKP